MTKTEITRVATQEGVDPQLVAALISVESGGDFYAWRTEPAYRYLWDVKSNKPFRPLHQAEANNEKAPSDFRSKVGSANTEWIGQQASWGPMQIMGAVARELGFTEHFPELCGESGLVIGCKFLRKLTNKYQPRYGIEGVIAAYNAGSPKILGYRYTNQSYVDKVLAVLHG